MKVEFHYKEMGNGRLSIAATCEVTLAARTMISPEASQHLDVLAHAQKHLERQISKLIEDIPGGERWLAEQQQGD